MAQEIERKFLVVGEDWKAAAQRTVFYRQGYINDLRHGGRCSVRVRIGGGKAYLNIKSATLGIARHEFEYAIPEADANHMLDAFALGAVVEKTRYYLPDGGHMWEIDVFEGDNAGLIVAEIELQSVDEKFSRPEWVGQEVSDDPRYYNVNLVTHPYKSWTQ